MEKYGLGLSNTSGSEPLSWKALGTYEGRFRQLLLKIKQQPESRTGRAVIQLLAKVHPLPKGVLLVPHTKLEEKAQQSSPVSDCSRLWAAQNNAAAPHSGWA
tara:strand:- start:292 stop:597 length:306 start_codon:yes stop_codon:yes gene_type:complete